MFKLLLSILLFVGSVQVWGQNKHEYKVTQKEMFIVVSLKNPAEVSAYVKGKQATNPPFYKDRESGFPREAALALEKKYFTAEQIALRESGKQFWYVYMSANSEGKVFNVRLYLDKKLYASLSKEQLSAFYEAFYNIDLPVRKLKDPNLYYTIYWGRLGRW